MSQTPEFLSARAFGLEWDGSPRVVKAETISRVAAAHALVAAAERRAADIEADARRVYDERFRQGYDDGKAAAEKALVEHLFKETAALEASLASIEADLERMVVEAMKRLVGELTEEQRVSAVVAGAMRKFRKTHSVRIVLHADRAMHREAIEALVRSMVPSLQFIEFGDDHDGDPDDVLVETPIGRVETRLSKEIEAIARTASGAAAEGEDDRA